MERNIKNTVVDPQNLCDSSINQVLHRSVGTVKEKLRILSNLSIADLKVFIPELLSQV